MATKEWFIGGPWHGLDKNEIAPNVPDYGAIRYDITGWLCDLYPNYAYSDLGGGEYSTYTRHVETIGVVDIPIWIDLRVMPLVEAASKLAELLLSHHESPSDKEVAE